MADPAHPQALPDDPSRQTAADPAWDPDIPQPSSPPTGEVQASPAADAPRHPGVDARTERDHLAIATELGVEAPRFSQSEQPERFSAWSDRVDQLLIQAQRGEPEHFEVLKRETNAYGGHPQPAEPLARPTPQGLRSIAQELRVEAPAASEAASSERNEPKRHQARAIGDPQTQMAAFAAVEKLSPDSVATPQAAGPVAVEPDRNLTPATPAEPRATAPVDAVIRTDPVNPVSQAPTQTPDAAPVAAQPEQQTTAKIPGVAALAVNNLADALRRKEPRPAPSETPAAPDAKTPAPPSSPLDASRDATESLALNSLLKNFRRQQPPVETAGPDASTDARLDPNASASRESAAASSPPPSGGASEKLALFETARMQSRRDLEQINGAANAGAGVLQSLAALEQQQSASILNRIRDAAKTSGGIERVLSEMRPGGAYEDLRKEFNAALAQDEGFAAAYDEAAEALAGYAGARADVGAIVKARPQTNLAQLEALDQDIVKAVTHLPGKENGKGMLDEALANGREALDAAFAAVRDAFGQNAGQTVRGPSPSPSLGR